MNREYRLPATPLTAIDSSLCLRRASLAASQLRPSTPQDCLINSRKQSCGKIVKNRPYRNSENVQPMPMRMYGSVDMEAVMPGRRSSSGREPMVVLGSVNLYERDKIRKIEDKYKNMLETYEIKKRLITTELNTLKHQPPQTKACKSKTYLANNSREGAEVPGGRLGRELIVEKLGATAGEIRLKKKDKVIDLYPQFFRALRSQIMLEEELRNIKMQIKPEISKEVLALCTTSLPGSQSSLIELDPEEWDPFLTATPSPLSPEALAAKLVAKHHQCQSNWREKVCQLSAQQATHIFSSLNFQKQPQICLKSLVRELSFVLEKHLRNRDLLRVYQRVQPLTEARFCSVLAKH